MCTGNKNTLHLWSIDYCSLSTSKSYYSTQHLIQHSVVCIATLRRTNDNDEWFKNGSRETRNNDPTKRLNDIHQTSSQRHPLNVPSHQGRQTQEDTIHQHGKAAGGAAGISEWFSPGKWAISNCNVIWLNLWYLICWTWEVSSWWIKMEFERQYDEFTRKWGLQPGKEGVPDVESRVGKGSDDGDGGVWNELEGCKSRARRTYQAEQPIHAEHRRNAREEKILECKWGPPNQGLGCDRGAPTLEEERRPKQQYRVLNVQDGISEWGVPMEIEQRLL